MHKDSKLRRKEIARQLAARQFAKAEKNGSAGAYVHKLREKPYALVYAEKVRKMNEQRTESKEKEDATTRI